MKEKFELILCIVNSGFSELVMSCARDCGAKGGTVIQARGTAKDEVEKAFNISIHPEKEIVMILVNKTIKEAVLHAVYKNVGLDSPGQGIAFSVPVDDVVGIDTKK
jgi:nitrogen regulatory protein PII